ncbi:MAG: hypothetical protein ABUL72_03715, partial [Armatimonadota bacterium]
MTTFAGGGASGVNGSGTVAGFSGPASMAFNPVDGALFVVETGGHRVRRITPTGQVSTVAGTGAAGAVDGAGTSASFNAPLGLTVAADSTIYVGDTTNNRIRKIVKSGIDPTLPASYSVSTICGAAAGFADGTGSAALFKNPMGLALDGNGALFVADTSNYRIRRIDLATNTVVTIAGNGAAQSVDGIGTTTASMGGPRGVAWVKGSLVVSDFSQNCLRQVSLIQGASPTSGESWYVSTIAGFGAVQGSFLNGDGNVARFSAPYMIAASGTEAVYVADLNNKRVRKVAGVGGTFPVGAPVPSSGSNAVTMSSQTGLVASNVFGTQVPYVDYDGPIGPGESSASKYWSFVVPAGVNTFQFSVMTETDTPVLI